MQAKKSEVVLASFEKRAKKLVAQMTLEEKVSQMLYQAPAIERLGLKAYNWWNEALHGIARAGVATVFPQAIGLAAMFDTAMVQTIADAISSEGRARYHAFSEKGDRDIYKGLTFWGPNINIFRDPRWGRGHETYGEDPYLTAENGKAYVRGIQGEDSVYWKASACAKHFAVHSGPEAERHYFNAEVNPKDFRETYLYAFERVVKETDVSGVMGAYNAVNGEPSCASKTLLQDILREEWGFTGYITSDCWAIKDIHEGHRVTCTPTESVALAVKNGCNLNCGGLYIYLLNAVEAGLVSEEDIDYCVERLMMIRLRLGMLDEPQTVPYIQIPYDVVACSQHKALALEAAEKSMVLLKNHQNLLPLDPSKLRRVAVIGPNANSRASLIGNYHGTASAYCTALEGITHYLTPHGVEVRFAEGCHLFKDRTEPLADAGDRYTEAVIEAERADVVILCLGLDETLEGEEGDTGNSYASGDKQDLFLPEPQRILMDRILATGTPTVAVVFAGSALDVEDERLSAWLQAWYPGERGGDALARILFGEVSPSGRLPVTFYRGEEELPDFRDYAMKGRTYRYFEGVPLYPFGYGLSYAQFAYSNLQLADDKKSVTVCVKNISKFPSREVVQMYVSPPEGLSDMPKWSLKGFVSVDMLPGEEKNVQLELTDDTFRLFDSNGKGFVSSEPYIVYVGGGQPTADTAKVTVSWQEKT